MTATDHIDLIKQLGSLGDEIDLDLTTAGDAWLVDDVLADIESGRPSEWRRPLMVAASIALIVTIGVLLVPDSRRAVANWFGISGVQIEIESDLNREPVGEVRAEVGPGTSKVVVVGGREILVSAIDATFDERLITKTVSGSDQLTEVDVGDSPGLWIGAESHEVLYEVSGSEVVVERIAGKTLLWNDGEVLYRVEGFDRLDEALEFARVGVVALADD